MWSPFPEGKPSLANLVQHTCYRVKDLWVDLRRRGKSCFAKYTPSLRKDVPSRTPRFVWPPRFCYGFTPLPCPRVESGRGRVRPTPGRRWGSGVCLDRGCPVSDVHHFTDSDTLVETAKVVAPTLVPWTRRVWRRTSRHCPYCCGWTVWTITGGEFTRRSLDWRTVGQGVIHYGRLPIQVWPVRTRACGYQKTKVCESQWEWFSVDPSKGFDESYQYKQLLLSFKLICNVFNTLVTFSWKDTVGSFMKLLWVITLVKNFTRELNSHQSLHSTFFKVFFRYESNEVFTSLRPKWKFFVWPLKSVTTKYLHQVHYFPSVSWGLII